LLHSIVALHRTVFLLVVKDSVPRLTVELINVVALHWRLDVEFASPADDDFFGISDLVCTLGLLSFNCLNHRVGIFSHSANCPLQSGIGPNDVHQVVA
jgi:hypothetical protein